MWGTHLTNAVASSLIVWSCVLIFHIFVLAFTDFTKIYFLYLVAAVFELLIIFWFTYRWFMANKGKRKNDKSNERN